LQLETWRSACWLAASRSVWTRWPTTEWPEQWVDEPERECANTWSRLNCCSVESNVDIRTGKLWLAAVWVCPRISSSSASTKQRWSCRRH
jgi:hypothetical protein